MKFARSIVVQCNKTHLNVFGNSNQFSTNVLDAYHEAAKHFVRYWKLSAHYRRLRYLCVLIGSEVYSSVFFTLSQNSLDTDYVHAV